MKYVNNPYPGLRPFTESESLFFKGRDQHVRDIITQLEDKKILILTGSSGDGKSSLVYAGVAPQARAGFFRAPYERWRVVDFRPQRNPLDQMAEALAPAFAMDTATVRQELTYGFSSLVALYKESACYREHSSAPAEGANVLLIADQFEEFFTHSENFYAGRATPPAYTAVNLLLETARIARSEGLPIYIICTMRSDYISQCVAYKGLPEMIGYSQFFVPRLNRQELQQVIEEPARLAGGEVAKRLSEVLVNALGDGFDKLPVLQHALNQLWRMAGNGREPLDLIHLAQVGGLPANQLPPEARATFQAYLESLSPSERAFYRRPRLANVLDSHATRLYEQAHAYHQKHAHAGEAACTPRESRDILRIAFQCLTKIDEGRTVRYRMSLREIARIIDRPQLSIETLNGLINRFREDESAFIRPYIDDAAPETRYLSIDTELDITHEALIRNWKLLRQWGQEEEAHYRDLEDLKVQLRRWREHQRDAAYLLPIGPLTHFEQWFKEVRPNAHWLSKYEDPALHEETRLQRSEKWAQEIAAFLGESREKVDAEEAARRKRRRGILVASALTILILSGFTFWALDEKESAERQKVVAEQQRQQAMEANLVARRQRERAERNAQEALQAKQVSDSARQAAVASRQEAEAERRRARREAERARLQKQVAERNARLAQEQQSIAQRERSQADSARRQAENARERSQALSFLALAQTLSYKATGQYDDSQLPMLLALQAFTFHRDNDGRPDDPNIYKGLRFAWSGAGHTNHIDLEGSGSAEAFHLGDQHITYCDRRGQLLKQPLSGVREEVSTLLAAEGAPINQAWMVAPEQAVVTREDGSHAWLDADRQTQTPLTGFQDYLRTVAVRGMTTSLLAADRQGRAIAWSLDGSQVKEQFRVDLGAGAYAALATEQRWLLGMRQGAIVALSARDGVQETIRSLDARITAMDYTRDDGQAWVGTATGRLLRLDPRADAASDQDWAVSKAPVTALRVQQDGKWVAVATADRQIRLFDRRQPDDAPIILEDHGQPVINLQFYEDRLYALTENNRLYHWETSAQAYARKIRDELKRSLTENEWKRYVSDVLPYQPVEP